MILKGLTELGCLKKLIAQTYDGAAVMSGEFNGVQAKVKDSAPALHIPKCNIFFSTLGGLLSFFTSSSKGTAVLDDMVKK